MKTWFAVLVALAACAPAGAARTGYSLYYLDAAGAVRRADLEVSGTHTLAWAKEWGEIQIAEVSSSARGVTVKRLRILGDASYSDLTYVPGKGLCFASAANGGQPVHLCSPDVKTIKPSPKIADTPLREAYEVMKSHKGALARRAEHSPDRRFIACPVREGKGAPTMQVFDSTGRLVATVAQGSSPSWKGDNGIR